MIMRHVFHESHHINFTRPCLLFLFGLIGWTVSDGPLQARSEGDGQNRYNVLFIAVDDLRPELGAYGVSYVDTPNIDRLASEGVTFLRHYAQVPTCGASRYALLTGRSPASSGVTRSNNALFQGPASLEARELSSAQSMPELFRRSGYYTVGIGKISHTPDGKVYAYEGSGDGRPELPNAWDELPTPYGPWKYGWGAFFAYPGGKHREDGKGNADLMNFQAQRDEELPDGLIAQTAIAKLGELKQRGQPFFLGVGFYKPHLPFVAPQQDHDAVAAWAVPPPLVSGKPDSPYWHNSGEFYRYEAPFEKMRPLASEASMQTKRVYLAAVRYVDRQIGKVLDALEEQGLADSTIVILWSDHGWALGEFAIWGKHALFERALHSPLIIRTPGAGMEGRTTDALVESIDLYPTLIDLCRPRFVETRYELDGRSLAPILSGQADDVRSAALSYWKDEVSVRTPTHRLIARGGPDQWRDAEVFDLRQGPDIPGIRAREPLDLTDPRNHGAGFLPTFPEAAGPESPEDIRGRSFFPHFLGEPDAQQEQNSGEGSDGSHDVYPIRSIRSAQWKYIRKLDPEKEYTFPKGDYLKGPAEELYNLASDPDEERNLVADPQHAERLQRMRDELDAWMNEGDERPIPDEPRLLDE